VRLAGRAKRPCESERIASILPPPGGGAPRAVPRRRALFQGGRRMARPDRPFIGVNADFAPGGKHGPAQMRRAPGSPDAVAAAGGLPVVVPPMGKELDAGPLLDRLDGFVLTGGADMDPRRLGLPGHAAVVPLPERRDEG